MNKILRFGLLILGLQVGVWAQQSLAHTSKLELSKEVPTLALQTPDLGILAAEDILRDKQGVLYRIGVALPAHLTPQNAGHWTTNADGSRTWQMVISAPGAEALSYLFEKFVLHGGSTLRIQNLGGQDVHPVLTSADVEAHQMQNAALCGGSKHVLTLTEPAYTTPSEIYIDRVMYNYRSTGFEVEEKINESDPCEVNVNCSPVGDAWQDEKRGVARIYVVEGNQAGWCSGSLINNTAQDCKPYFLTALHCGVSATAANMNQWKFYFRYEAAACTNPTTVGSLASYFVTGCLRIADAADGGGNSGSDFLLVKLGNANNENTVINNLKSANLNAYWNGWNASTSPTTGGVSIHHPAGDIKKISTFSGNTVSTQWGTATGSHWRVTWTANTNGHGVTEGGSSGSPLFDNTGNIIGTLTGGSSYCTALSAPDQYGKMAFHWTNNGTTAIEQLKPWLDPANLNVLVFGGSADPCTPTTPVAPVANFVASATSVAPATTVSFTDLSTGIPTSWAWSISPATGWSYAGGSNASTQNPQIVFNTVGQYTVSLTATNAQGSDVETKNNYIVVAQVTGPCTASAVCDEYIAAVSFNTINNTSACGNNGYTDFTSTSTSLAQGTAYTLTITPAIVNNTQAAAYTNDEIAAWIDFNNDFDFNDAGEQVAYVLVATGWVNTFNVSIPLASSTGPVRMRVRISYQPDGAITPCGPASYGETEDYTINITSGAGLNDNPLGLVQMYPNPAQDLVYIDLKNLGENGLIEILDVNGKILSQTTGIAGQINTVGIAQLANGLYHVRMSANGQQFTQRLIKN
ncbi:MAG: T9SS type A sorting domain-containing protein [Crocinitomicaceae bacterium]|nr:T9SS type A sorting domain-containing protein [Crocinitomicaceae bacterium]